MVSDDDVVEEIDADNSAGFGESFGDFDVFRARGRILSRVNYKRII